MNDSTAELIGASSFGFLAGLKVGSNQYSHLAPFEPMIKAMSARTGQLSYQKVIKPIPTHQAVPLTAHTMAEAVGTFVHGFFDSAVYSVGKTLELALGEAYHRDQGKDPPSKLEDRINWFGSKDSQNKPLASSIQILRNTIHTGHSLTEQQAVEAVRHACVVLNIVFPFNDVNFPLRQQCTYCGNIDPYDVPVATIFYGNQVPFNCSQCRATFLVLVEY